VQQFCAEHGFVYAHCLLEGSSRTLLLAIGFIMAASQIFEAHTALNEQGLHITTPLPPYPDQTVQQCMDATRQPDAACAQRHGDACAPQQGDVSVWHRVEREGHEARHLLHTFSQRQRQLQGLCAANVALTARISAAGKAAGVGHLTPYEAMVICRPVAFEAHMRDVRALSREAAQRALAAKQAEKFFAWIGRVHAAESAARDTVRHASSSVAATSAHTAPRALHMPAACLDCSSEELVQVRVVAVAVTCCMYFCGPKRHAWHMLSLSGGASVR